MPYNGTTTSKLLSHACQIDKQPRINDFLSSSTSNASPASFSREEIDEIREAASQFVVNDIRPFYAVEGEGLRNFLKAIVKVSKRHPNMSEADIDRLLPSRRVIKRYVYNKSIEMKKIIKNDFKRAIESVGGFCVTLDLYSDKYKCNNYLGITAKMNILSGDEIEQKEYVINLDAIYSTKKTGQVVREEIIKVLNQFDLTENHMRENITWITDREGNIRVALEKCVRINCFAHLLNNVVEHMCKEIVTVKKLVSDAASLVRYLKKAGLTNQNLSGALQSYCETRWNTVFYLFRSIIINYNSIFTILSEREKLKPSVTDKLTCLPKTDLAAIADFLELFSEITVHVQGEKYETIHTVWPYFHAIEKHLVLSHFDSPIVRLMKIKGREYITLNITKFCPTMVHRKAVFLHPALKHLNCGTEMEKEEIINHMKSLIPNDVGRNITTNVESIETATRKRSTLIFGDFLKPPIQDIESNTSSNEVERYVAFETFTVRSIKHLFQGMKEICTST